MAALLRASALALALSSALSGAGCTDYLDRRDTLSLETGDAVQANIATHVIDPWPPKSRFIDRDGNGERLQRGIERYRNPQSSAGNAPSQAPSAFVPSSSSGSTGLR